jgi:RHS repeat-associated protein
MVVSILVCAAAILATLAIRSAEASPMLPSSSGTSAGASGCSSCESGAAILRIRGDGDLDAADKLVIRVLDYSDWPGLPTTLAEQEVTSGEAHKLDLSIPLFEEQDVYVTAQLDPPGERWTGKGYAITLTCDGCGCNVEVVADPKDPDDDPEVPIVDFDDESVIELASTNQFAMEDANLQADPPETEDGIWEARVRIAPSRMIVPQAGSGFHKGSVAPLREDGGLAVQSEPRFYFQASIGRGMVNSAGGNIVLSHGLYSLLAGGIVDEELLRFYTSDNVALGRDSNDQLEVTQSHGEIHVSQDPAHQESLAIEFSQDGTNPFRRYTLTNFDASGDDFVAPKYGIASFIRGLRVEDENLDDGTTETVEYRVLRWIPDPDPMQPEKADYYFQTRRGNLTVPSETLTETIASELYGNEKRVTMTIEEGHAPKKTIEEVYVLVGGDEKLRSRTIDPGGIGITTTYHYVTDINSPAHKQLLRIDHPDGSCEDYDYVLTPHVEFVTTVTHRKSVGGATLSERSYTNTASDGVENSINFARVSETQTSGNGGDSGLVETVTTGGSGGNNLEVTTIEHTGVLVDGDDSLRSKTVMFPLGEEDDTDWLRGRIISRWGLAGEETQLIQLESYEYDRGEAKYDETTSPPTIVFPNPGGWSGATIEVEEVLRTDFPDALQDSKSTRTRTLLDERGREILSEMQIRHENDFETATTTVTKYDNQGRVVGSWKDGLLTSSHLYDPPNRKVTSTSVDGKESSVETDALGRPKRLTQGAGGGVPELETVFYYPPVGSTEDVRSEVTSAGGLSLTASTRYDQAARVVEQTDAAGLVTTTDYLDLGLTVQVTNPDTSTVVTSYSPGGEFKSRTGSGVVGRFTVESTESVNGKNFAKTIDYTGVLGGPNFNASIVDLAGRSFRTIAPGPNGNSIETTYGYNAAGQVGSLSTTSGEVSSHAPRLYLYGPRGRLEKQWQDMDGSGQLDEYSPTDRVSYSYREYELADGAWWEVTKSVVFADRDSDMDRISFTKSRLSATAAGLISESRQISPDGLETHTATVVEPANMRRTTTTEVLEGGAPLAGTVAAIRVFENGLLASERTAAVAELATFKYDALRRQIVAVDPRTKRSFITHYDPSGRVDYTVDLSGNTSKREYYPNGVPGAGRISKETNAQNKEVLYTYDLRGNVATVRGSASYPIDYSYDSTYGWLDHITTFRDLGAGEKNYTTWVRDHATGLLRYKLDSRYDPTAPGADPDSDAEAAALAGKGTSYDYDDFGRLKERSWARGVTTTYGYDAPTGDLTSVDYGDGTKDLILRYNRVGEIDQVTDGAGVQEFTLSSTGKLDYTEVTTEDGGSNILDGLIIDPTLGAGGRTDSLSVGFGGTAATTGNVYTGPGGQLSAVTLTVGADTRSASYTFHTGSPRVADVSFDDGSAPLYHSSYLLDGANRINVVRNSLTGTAGEVVSSHAYRYNSLNKRERATRHDGTYWEYSYNDRGELLSADKYLRVPNPGDELLAGYQTDYTYDEIGNRLDAHTGGNAQGAGLHQTVYSGAASPANNLNQYVHIDNSDQSADVLGRDPNPSSVVVTTSTSSIYEIPGQAASQPSGAGTYFRRKLAATNPGDAVFGMVTVTGSTGSPPPQGSGNIFIPPQSVSPTHDDDGNLLTDGRFTYTWDAENRLASVETHGSEAVTGKVKLEFAYDYLGRRIQKKTYPWIPGPAPGYGAPVVQKFVYDGWNPVATFSGSDALVQAYAWGIDLSGGLQGAGGVGGLLMVHDVSDSETYAPAFDGNGNVVAMVVLGAAGGVVAAEYEYDGFGRTLVSSGDFAERNPFGFSTKVTDRDTGLVYYGFRYYDPVTGRWPSRDPIEEEGGINLYGFVGNDAVNGWDYLGLDQYRLGEAKEPALDLPKPDFVYDPNAKPNIGDHLQWAKWNLFLEGAEIKRPDLVDGTRAYRWYLHGDGSDLEVNYGRAYKDDSIIRSEVDADIREAQFDAEDLAKQVSKYGQTEFEITGLAVRTLQPATENWRKTVGEHSIWGDAYVKTCVRGDPNRFEMQITIHAKDLYDFNRDAHDLNTGLPDNANGRFTVLGWGKPFIVYGEVTKKVTWTKGSVDGSSKIQDIGRGPRKTRRVGIY